MEVRCSIEMNFTQQQSIYPVDLFLGVDFSLATVAVAVDTYLGQFPIYLIVLWLIGSMGFLYLVTPRVAHFLVSAVYFYAFAQIVPAFYAARDAKNTELMAYTGTAMSFYAGIYLYSFFKAMN